MKLDDIITLLNAGYTKEDIEKMTDQTDQKASEQTDLKASEQTDLKASEKTDQKASEQTDLKASEKTDQKASEQTSDVLLKNILEQNNKLMKQLHEMNVKNANTEVEKKQSASDVIKNFITNI